MLVIFFAVSFGILFSLIRYKARPTVASPSAFCLTPCTLPATSGFPRRLRAAAGAAALSPPAPP